MAFVQAAKVILGVASPLFAEQHRLVVGDRNRVSPAVAELAIDWDAVIVLVGVFLLLWLRMLLLLVVVVAPCSKSDDGSTNGGRGRRNVPRPTIGRGLKGDIVPGAAHLRRRGCLLLFPKIKRTNWSHYRRNPSPPPPPPFRAISDIFPRSRDRANGRRGRRRRYIID